MSDVYSSSKKRTLSNPLRLPEEIFDEILLRLPSKSVGRCSAVCKSWNSLVNTFICYHTRDHTRYQSNNHHDEAQLLFLQFHNSLRIINRGPYALHRDNSACNLYTKLPNPFVACNKLPTCLRGAKQVEDVTVVGTCNGLVCLVAGDDEIHFAASLWNPCIRKLVALPKPGLAVYKAIDQVRYGFGYDSCTDDYKVLRCVNHKYIRHSTCQVEIWSLARGSWKSLSSAADHVILPANFHPGQLFNRSGVVFVNGALHWLQLARNWKVNKMDYLVASFDMASELFGETTVPEALQKKLYSKPGRREWFISRYRESIALVKICKGRDRWIGCRVEIWVMAEYGVAASWVNLCTVQLQDVWLMPLIYKDCGPIGFRTSGEVVLVGGNGRSMLLDPESEQVSEFEIDESNNHLKFMDYFVESLVLFDQPNAISY
ncbi:PREDICTED: F-box/kelch-repeat protein At3g23880-like [Prunus mume]|uniref:F-box/kelch-repeat protein At3g23880-like n=1 Tax=Prunus mume TaxID=102107 RepID=A0ABM0P899_PRUMU|nr:PREDICTED: F-box/kelch-repeat protein At3g23880-like [Prunus mume]